MYMAYLDNITNIVYFGLICVFLSQYILTSRRATLEVIFASMCLYMLLAALWAAIFTNLELYYGAAFSFNGQLAEEAGITRENMYRHMIYYSFVTLSTLGYGDIIPIHMVSHNWAAFEAMIGQFYIAVVIARLVSVYTVEGEEEMKKGAFR
jgi:ABC-type multidrug transport system fused ATPase/permease subunit